MNQEKQRIKIAEACGWKITLWPSGDFRRAESPNGNQYFEVPDYLSDLNAMHEAVVGVLNHGSPQMNWDYAAHLGRITGSGIHVTTALIHATAAQRAEAFLKTLNLWKQETK